VQTQLLTPLLQTAAVLVQAVKLVLEAQVVQAVAATVFILVTQQLKVILAAQQAMEIMVQADTQTILRSIQAAAVAVLELLVLLVATTMAAQVAQEKILGHHGLRQLRLAFLDFTVAVAVALLTTA
jgi:hypothetical protein